MSAPAWLALEGREPVPEALVDRVAGALGSASVVAAALPAGREATPLLAAMAAQLGGAVHAVRCQGAESAEDLVRAVGDALDVVPFGDTTAVGAQLGALGGRVLLLEGCAVPRLHEALDPILARAPELRVLAVGSDGLEGLPVLGLDPAPWNAGPDTDLPAGRDARALAWLPAGTREAAPRGVDDSHRVAVRGLCVLRDPVAASLRGNPATAAATLQPLAQPLLELAVGRSPPWLPRECDVQLLRLLYRSLPDAWTRAWAAAALARLLARVGQPDLGRSVLVEARGLPLEAGERALIEAADGAVLLDSGLVRAGTEALTQAVSGLVTDPTVRAVLSRRVGDHMVLRGSKRSAQACYREARAIWRRSGQDLGVAATLRADGDSAVAAGEVVGAESLYELAGAALSAEPRPGFELASLELGRASLALTRGELASAERYLAEADLSSHDDPTLRAAVERRWGELRLRQGRQGQADEHLARALDLYERLGERLAAASTLRAMGDAAAAAGAPELAAERYSRGTALSARAGDLGGARRCLEHALALEFEQGSDERAETLQALLRETDAFFGERTATASKAE